MLCNNDRFCMQPNQKKIKSIPLAKLPLKKVIVSFKEFLLTFFLWNSKNHFLGFCLKGKRLFMSGIHQGILLF